MTFARMVLMGLCLLPLPAAAQAPAVPLAAQAGIGAGIPEALRGAWATGPSCEAPEAVLFLTARGAISIPASGRPAVRRFVTVGIATGGWTLGTSGGTEAGRLALRSPGPDRLDAVEPAAKTRDDRLPGPDATPRQWRRCPTMPAATAEQAEAIAALLVLEQAEAACGPGAVVAECLAGIHARIDLTGDGALSTAELARLGRGAAALAALQSGSPVPPGVAEAALLAARRLVEELDYDGNGGLSPAEILQDRAGLGAAVATAKGPLEVLPPMPGLDILRGMMAPAAR